KNAVGSGWPAGVAGRLQFQLRHMIQVYHTEVLVTPVKNDRPSARRLGHETPVGNSQRPPISQVDRKGTKRICCAHGTQLFGSHDRPPFTHPAPAIPPPPAVRDGSRRTAAPARPPASGTPAGR